MTDKTFTNGIKDTIHKWLMEDGWSLRKESLPDAIWAFVAEDQQGRRIIVGQKASKSDELLLQASVTIDDELSSKIDQLSKDERDGFLWDLRFELLRTNLEFDGIEAPLKQVTVLERTCFDALTKDSFLQRLSQARKGILIVQWMLMRKFAKQPPEKQMGFRK